MFNFDDIGTKYSAILGFGQVVLGSEKTNQLTEKAGFRGGCPT